MSSKKPSTSIVGTDGPSYLALAPREGKSIEEVIKKNVGPGGITPEDLPRVRIPGGGGKAWDLEDGPASDFPGIILAHRERRAWWAEKFATTGGGVPPDCYSPDCELGVGRFGQDSSENPTGECATCPMSQWGTATNERGEPGRGQACAKRHVLLVLPRGSLLPVVVDCAPSSLKNVRGYLTRLASKGLAHDAVETVFGLEQTKAGGGITYSRILPTLGEVLSDDDAKNVERYVGVVMGAFEGVQPEQVPE